MVYRKLKLKIIKLSSLANWPMSFGYPLDPQFLRIQPVDSSGDAECL